MPSFDTPRFPEWAIPGLRSAGPFGPMLAGLGRGAKIDLADNPDFGIPLLGHFLALPSLASGLLASGLDDANSPALQRARDAGVLTSYRERTDIPELAKVASDFVMSLPMGGPTGAVTRGIARGAGRVAPSLVRAAGPLAGPVASLLGPSKTALVNEAGEGAATLASRLRAAGVHPDDALNALSELRDGTLSPEAASLALRVGNPTGLAAQQFAGKVDPEHLLKLWDVLNPAGGFGPPALQTLPKALQRAAAQAGGVGPDAFYSVFDPLARSAARGELGVQASGRFAQGYRTANQALKELLMSGGTSAIQNATDVTTKAGLAGISPLQIGRDMAETLRTGTLAEAGQRLGAAGAPAELGLETALQGTLGASQHDLLVNKIGLPRMAGLGAILGALTGNPLTALTGAATGAMTHVGANVTAKTMQGVESAARLRFLLEGGKRFIAGDPEITGRYAAEAAQAAPHLAEIQRLAGAAAPALKDAITQEGSFVTPDRVGQLAAGLGVSVPDSARIAQSWRSVHDLAQAVGTKFSDAYNFPYSRPSNLEQGLRTVTPFPTFALRNVPFYLREMGLRHPGIGTGVSNYLGESDHQVTEAGLPPRYFGSVPVLGTPDSGQVWANPISALSITSQLHPPKPTQPGEPGFEPIMSKLEAAGMSLNPMLDTLGQLVGLLGQGQDIPTILPWSRRFAPLGQVLTGGRPNDPEAALRAPLEAVRAAIAPGSVPIRPYEAQGLVPPPSLPDYLVRKRLFQDSLERTGKSWWDNPEYVRAVADRNSPLYQEAARTLGAEQALMTTTRALLPFEQQYVSPEETHRGALIHTLTQGGRIPPVQWGGVGAMDRNSPAYKNLPMEVQAGQGIPQDEVTKAKYVYYQGLTPDARRAFAALNPDLALFLGAVNRTGRPSQPPPITTRGRP